MSISRGVLRGCNCLLSAALLRLCAGREEWFRVGWKVTAVGGRSPPQPCSENRSISPTAVLRNRSLHHREIAKEMIQKAETAGCKVSDPRRAGLLRDHPRAARLCSI